MKSIQAVGATIPSANGYYSWSPNWAAYCGLLNLAASLETLANQNLPANGWIIHPSVDGCGSYPTTPPAPFIP
jgi:hypothetical protein